MIPPGVPLDEPERLKALRDSKLLDSPPDERLDRLTRLTQRLFEVPITLLSLVDEHRQWFKSKQGITASEFPRETSFCGHTILDEKTLVVPDAKADARFQGNPLVEGEPGIRFYAGHPLRAPNGTRMGTLCVIDREPRTFAAADAELLRDMAWLVEQDLHGALLSDALDLLKTGERRIAELSDDLRGRVLELESLVSDLDLFAHAAAHDLRAPVRRVDALAEMLLTRSASVPLNADGRELAARIRSTAAWMDSIIGALLTYSGLRGERLPAEFVESDAVVTQALETLSAETEAKGASIAVERPLPPVKGQKALLGLVMVNFLSNALRFVIPGSKPVVRVGARRRNGAVRLWVRDEGIGIEPLYHERIFRAFERLNPSDSYPGTGMGLAIVSRAVERMGGRVGVESRPGAGSLFWVELPAA